MMFLLSLILFFHAIHTNNNNNTNHQVGMLINDYLTSSIQTDDRAIHLLFSANRWEAAPKLATTLAQGTNIICDRYAYSGVAFTSAKTNNDRSTVSGGDLTLNWCIGPDIGLPAPDAVIFLDLDQNEAEKRGG
jgi:dTMP kinase